jgi:hypothetical protein
MQSLRHVLLSFLFIILNCSFRILNKLVDFESGFQCDEISVRQQ